MHEGPESPKSFIEFQDRFRTDRACEEHLFAWRWPRGFRCPGCAGSDAARLRTRPVYQCRTPGCRRQTSVTAGTVLHRTRIPLRKWFWAIFIFSRHKKGISAQQLCRDLGLGSWRTAWFMLQRLRSCLEEEDAWPLDGLIEVDETFVGARGKHPETGKKQPNKAIVVGAVQLGEGGGRGLHRWAGLRLAVVPDHTAKSLGSFVHSCVRPGSTLRTDGWQAYEHLGQEGYEHEAEASSSMSRAEMRERNPLPHVHLLFSNLKTWLTGRFHGVTRPYLADYLREFVYRTSRRHDPPMIFDWVVRRVTRHGPCPLTAVRAH